MRPRYPSRLQQQLRLERRLSLRRPAGTTVGITADTGGVTMAIAGITGGATITTVITDGVVTITGGTTAGTARTTVVTPVGGRTTETSQGRSVRGALSSLLNRRIRDRSHRLCSLQGA